MKRVLLTTLLCVMFAADTFGWDLSLAPGLSVKNAFLYLIIMVYMIETAVFRNHRLELPSVLVPFGLLVGYCIFSWSVMVFIVRWPSYPVVDTAISLKTNRFDHFLIFLLFLYGLSERKDVLALLRGFLWMLVIGNLITVVDGFNIPDLGIIQQRDDGRLGGPMGESNQYGALLALSLPAIVALLWDKGTKKLYAYAACFISIVALLAASSRGAFAGIIVGSIFSIFYLRSFLSMRRVAIGALATVASIVVIVLAFLSTNLVGELIQRMAEQMSGSSSTISSGRTMIWGTALQQIHEQPFSLLTGFGYDAWYYIYRLGGYNPHNVYLHHLFDLGLPGLTLYCILMYNLISICRRALRGATDAERGQLIAFVFGLVSLNASLFFVDLYKPWLFIWAYAGMIMRLAIATIDSEKKVSGLHVTA